MKRAELEDGAGPEKIMKRAIIRRDMTGEDICNTGKNPVELICHNGHAWSKYPHFPQSREVYICEGDAWHAIREATRDQPIAVWLLGGGDNQLNVD